MPPPPSLPCHRPLCYIPRSPFSPPHFSFSLFSSPLPPPADLQSCLICVARRVPMKERPMLPAHESFTTRQDLQGTICKNKSAGSLSPKQSKPECRHYFRESSRTDLKGFCAGTIPHWPSGVNKVFLVPTSSHTPRLRCVNEVTANIFPQRTS